MQNINGKVKRSGEYGRGVLEYGVALVLILLALISLVAIFGPDIRQWMQENLPSSSPDPAPPTITYQETDTYTEFIETEEVSVTNCESITETQTIVERTKEESARIEIPDPPADQTIRLAVISALYDFYGIDSLEPAVENYQIRLSVPPGKQVVYTIEWHWDWKEGRATATSEDGNVSTFDYLVRTGLDFDIQNSQETDCNP